MCPETSLGSGPILYAKGRFGEAERTARFVDVQTHSFAIGDDHSQQAFRKAVLRTTNGMIAATTLLTMAAAMVLLVLFAGACNGP
jgi:hypothetical protein